MKEMFNRPPLQNEAIVRWFKQSLSANSSLEQSDRNVWGFFLNKLYSTMSAVLTCNRLFLIEKIA